MKRTVIVFLLAAGVSAAEEAEEREAREHERMEAHGREQKMRQHKRMIAFKRTLSKEISVEFVEQPLGEAVQFIVEAAQVNVAVHKDIDLDEEINLKLDGFPVHAVLEILARICDLRLELENGVAILMPADDDREEIGEVWLETEQFGMDLKIYADDVPPDLRQQFVRRALMLAREGGEKEFHEFRREREEEEEERPRHRRPGRDEEF